jgi:archaellum component FlaC
MAGRLTGKKDPKDFKLIKNQSSEVLQDSQSDYAPKPPVKFSLKGILGLNQTVEINKIDNQKKEIFSTISHLEKEQNILFDQKQRELELTLKELREEIGHLATATDNLEKDVENIATLESTDTNEYQINFLIRVKNFIIAIRKNISQASIWVEAFAAKKKKRNAFWSTANNKKKGGTQYMFSDEHSAARSVN